MSAPSLRDPATPARRQWSVNRMVILAFALAALNGLLFTFLIPPWQHYDEPNHFEYVWLAANSGRFPQPGDANQKLSRQVLKSMIAHDFYRGGTPPQVIPGQPVQLPGYSQLDDPPAYYLLAALPAFALRSQSVTRQLFAARLVSLALFMVSILAAWGIMTELTCPGHPLRWMVPLSLGLLPAYADLMTAVNNDVGAAAFSALFLWGAVRLVCNGLNLIDLLWTGGMAALCVLTKATTLPVVALAPAALILSLARGRWRAIAWGAVALGLVVGLAAILSWGDAATWGRSTFQQAPTRTATPDAPLGDYALQLDLPDSASKNGQLHQLLTWPAGQIPAGKTLTVGAWIWAQGLPPGETIQVRLPALNAYPGDLPVMQTAEISAQPTFLAYTLTLPIQAQRAWLTVSPLGDSAGQPAGILLDGILVVEGEWPLDQAPRFADAQGETGEWGGRLFTNLARNPSAETAGLRLRPWVDQLGTRYLPDKGTNFPSIILYGLLDWSGARDYRSATARILNETIWARFGWGHVRLSADWVYSLLAVMAFAGVAGAAWGVWRGRRTLPWAALFLLLLATLLTLVQTSGRGVNYLIKPWPVFYPHGRYLYPVAIPLMALFNWGWYEIGRLLSELGHVPPKALASLYVTGILALDIYSIYTIWTFYHV